MAGILLHEKYGDFTRNLAKSLLGVPPAIKLQVLFHAMYMSSP
jgi:hypothetical protein